LTSEEIRTHTALHVLKGAVVKVLGAEWTAGVYAQGSRGRLTVQFDRKPSEEEMDTVERLANEKIAEDALIEVHDLERSEAEERWGDAIYDVFPIPSHITRLSVFHLPGWNVNACNKEHTATTGEIGSLRITKFRHRGKKGLLEISFEVS